MGAVRGGFLVYAVHDGPFIAAPGEGTLILFIVDGDTETCHLDKLLGHLFVCYGKLESLGLDSTGSVFAAVAGEDDFPFISFENVAGVGEGIEFAGFGSVGEDPPELEIQKAGQRGQHYEGDDPPDSFPRSGHSIKYWFI